MLRGKKILFKSIYLFLLMVLFCVFSAAAVIAPAQTSANLYTITVNEVTEVNVNAYDVGAAAWGNTFWDSTLYSVMFPTWTTHNGQDDLASDWRLSTVGNRVSPGTWNYTVYASEHNNEQYHYRTDIYTYAPDFELLFLGTNITIRDFTPPSDIGTLPNVAWTSTPAVGNLDFADGMDLGGSGINNNTYDIYWGTDPAGTTIIKTGTSDFLPAPLIAEGTYYLRTRVRDNVWNYSPWTTVMQYQFDNVAPVNTSTLSTGDESWTNVADRAAFTWAAGYDTTAGVKGYNVYWGTNPLATSGVFQVSNTYDPPAILASNIYYLRVQTVDKANNTSGWQTVLTYKCDIDAPGAPVTLSAVAWTNNPNPGILDFGDAIDQGGSDLNSNGYDIYWGTNPAGTTVSKNGSSDYDPGLLTIPGHITYYLRARARDIAGNVGSWTTIMQYQHDNKVPVNTITVATQNWTNAADTGVYSWAVGTDIGGAGVAGYRVYWGTSPTGTVVAAPQVENNYHPPVLTQSKVYYLRVQTVDAVGWSSDWRTVWTYYFDNELPVNTTTNTVDSWTNTANRLPFTWAPGSDTGGSTFKGYNVYWGINSAGTSTAFQSSTQYDPPVIPVSNIYYLRVQSVDVAGNTSGWQTVLTYHCDITPPGVAPTLNNQIWTHNADPETLDFLEAPDAGGSGTNPNGYEIYWGMDPNGATANAKSGTSDYDPSPIIGTGHLTYYLRARASDNTGTWGQWSTIMQYQYDNQAPINTTTAATQNWTNVADPGNYSWAAGTDIGGAGVIGYRIYWGTDPQGVGTEQISGTTYHPSLLTTSGVYYLRVQTVDAAGLVSGWQTVWTYHFDNDLPVNSTTNVLTSWNHAPNPPVFTWASGSDAGGSSFRGYNVYWGTDSNGSSTAFQAGTQYDPPVVSQSNVYYLRVQALDVAGNMSAWQTVLTYQFDRDLPFGSLFDAPPFCREDYYYIYINADDIGGSGVKFVNFPTWTSANGQDDLPLDWQTNPAVAGTDLGGGKWRFKVMANAHGNEDGLYHTDVYVYDYAGNTKNILTVTVNRDTTPPLAITMNIENGARYTNKTDVLVKVTATDGNSGVGTIRLSNDGVTWKEYPYGPVTWSLLPGNGRKTVYVRVYDRALNMSNMLQASIVLVRDIVKPEAFIDKDPTRWQNISANILITAVDFGSGPEQRTMIKNVTSNGLYGYVVRDKALNERQGDILVEYIDTTPPELGLTAGPTGWTNRPVTIAITVQDTGAGIGRIQTPDGLWHGAHCREYAVSRNGAYQFVVADKAGNVTTAAVTVSTIDLVAPTLVISGNPTQWTNTAVTLTATATDTAGIKRIRRPDGVWVNAAQTTYIAVKNGVYLFIAEDLAGNQTIQKIEVTRIDTTVIPPGITVRQKG